jgi:DNA-binding transcriptional regulator LsrR (DeoR family)
MEIRHEGVIDMDLSAGLRDRFGLRHAVVVQAPEDDPHPRRFGPVRAPRVARDRQPEF